MTGVAGWGLAWMIRLRWVAVGGILAAPFLARLFGIEISVRVFTIIATMVAAYNALLHLWTRPGRLVPESGIHAQILADWIALTGLLHHAGDARELLLPMYAYHVLIAAIVLSRKAAFTYAVLGGSLIGFLAQANVTWAAHAFFLILVAYLSSDIGNVLRKREAELLDSYRSLAEEERRKSQYVLMLAHSILLRLGDIERGLGTARGELSASISEAARGMLDRVERWVLSLRSFVEDVLNLSRMRANADLPRTYVYLPRILYQQVQEAGPLAREKNISIELDVPDRVPPLRGNDAALAQAIQNLLRNAVAYSDPGSSVGVRLAVEDSHLHLVVEDRGIGIAAKDLPYVFDEFYRSEAARNRESGASGLGLTIVKHVAELHQGTISVESEEGMGSRFTLRLPALVALGAPNFGNEANCEERRKAASAV